MCAEGTEEELVASWTLVGEDRRLVGNKSGATRLGFAVLVKFFEIEARFPRSSDEVPAQAISYVAEQVGVDPDEFARYRWDGRSIKYHREQIRAAFDFREFTRGDEAKVAGWLAEEVCPVELRDEQLREAVLVRCRAERIEPPGESTGSSAPPARCSRNSSASGPRRDSATGVPPGSSSWSSKIPTRWPRVMGCWPR